MRSMILDTANRNEDRLAGGRGLAYFRPREFVVTVFDHGLFANPYPSDKHCAMRTERARRRPKSNQLYSKSMTCATGFGRIIALRTRLARAGPGHRVHR